MNPFKKILRRFSAMFPADVLVKTSGIHVLLPYHHVVSDEHLPHIEELYRYKNRKEFMNDLDWLLKKFKPVHPDDLAKHIFDQKPLPKKSFLISFDDGFREIDDVIAPVLIEKGVPALFFINSAFADNKELFYRCKLSLVLNKIKRDEPLKKLVAEYIGCTGTDYGQIRKSVLKINYPNRHKADELGEIAEIDFENFLRKQQPFLTSQQIKKLQQQGFVFGGHSIDHPDYQFLNTDEQCRQTIASTSFANQLEQSRFHYFAFPHEDRYVRQQFFTQMNDKASYLFFGVQNQKIEKQNRVLHRFNAERPGEGIQKSAKAVMMYQSFLRVANRQHIIRK